MLTLGKRIYHHEDHVVRVIPLMCSSLIFGRNGSNILSVLRQAWFSVVPQQRQEESTALLLRLP